MVVNLELITIMLSTNSLKLSILSDDASADISILNQLLILVDKYNIRWISNKEGKGAYFIMSQLAVSLGKEPDDYKDHWTNLTGSVKSSSSKSLAGKAYKLEKEHLAKFKSIYKETYGESLGRINSLWVGDWIHAFAYLTQGYSNAAQEFQALGARAIKETTVTQLEEVQFTEQKKITEEELQKGIMQLASYSTVNFRFEVGVKNTFNSADNAFSRRWDWVEQLPRLVRVYELKPNYIREEDVVTTLLDKHYIELAREKYGKTIEFIFTSSKGISWEAKSLMQDIVVELNRKNSWKNKVSFIDLQEIADRLVNNIVNHNPAESMFWLLCRTKQADLEEVISKITINKLGNKISSAYSTGLLKNKHTKPTMLGKA